MSPSSAGVEPALLLQVAEASQVSEVRRQAVSLAQRLGFDATRTGKVAIVVTEAATNLVKHGGGGVMLLAVIGDGGPGLGMLALDQGPGLHPEAARDGFSTAGGAGIGLGGMRRLSDVFEVYSRPGGGTVLVTLWPARPARRPNSRTRVCGLSVARSGQEVCGDAWAVEERAGRTTVVLADGLGHGVEGARAASAAIRVFQARPALGPAALLAAMHDALRPTRGAAVAIAVIDPARALVTFAGVGNAAALVVSAAGTRRHLVSHNGIVGHTVRRIEEFTQPWETGALLVAHSDGLLNRWDLEAYPGLARRHPCLVAGVLLRDFRRTGDDVAVVVVQGQAA